MIKKNISFSNQLYKLIFFCLIISFLNNCKNEGNTPTTEASLNQVSTIVTYSPLGGYRDGPLEQAQFNNMRGIVFDANDNLYIAEYGNNRIRKITPEGIVSTYAGTGTYDLKDGPAEQAMFARPNGLTIDEAGNLYVAHYGAVRKITPDHMVSTLAGVAPPKVATLTYDTLALIDPSGICLDEFKNAYVTSHNGGISRVVKILPNGKYSVFIGVPFTEIPRPTIDQAKVYTPDGVTYDLSRHIFYITDASYGLIKATPQGASSCYLSCGSKDASIVKFTFAASTLVDKIGNVYVADETYIRKITPDGIVSIVAGTDQSGKQDGPGDKATFDGPSFMAFDSKGDLYVNDYNGIRKITLHK